jgi:CRP-like cAMP-binding protein
MFKTLYNHFKATNPDFTDEEFNRVIKLASVKEFPKKTILMKQGDHVKEGGFVYKGCFRYFITNSEGQERTTYFALEDYWIGNFGTIVNGEPSAQSIEALEDSIVIFFTINDYRLLLDTCKGFRKFTYIKRSRAYDAAIKKIVDLHEPAETRYLNLMNKYPEAINRIPLYHIASYLGIKPESLSRIRKKIAEEKA